MGPGTREDGRPKGKDSFVKGSKPPFVQSLVHQGWVHLSFSRWLTEVRSKSVSACMERSREWPPSVAAAADHYCCRMMGCSIAFSEGVATTYTTSLHLVVPIKLCGIIPFLYRIIPKIGRNTLRWLCLVLKGMKLSRLIAKINRRLQRDVKRLVECFSYLLGHQGTGVGFKKVMSTTTVYLCFEHHCPILAKIREHVYAARRFHL